MDKVIESGLVTAFVERRAKLNRCPARKRHLGDTPCPSCGSTTKGPCWLGVEADAAFVDAIKEIFPEQARDIHHGE